jgi:hypothetical protein
MGRGDEGGATELGLIYREPGFTLSGDSDERGKKMKRRKR